MQRVDVRPGQGGGRLVHHDETRLANERLGYLDQLLLRYRKAPRRPVERQGDVELGQHGGGRSQCGPAVQEQSAGRLVPEHDILHDVQVRNEVELLIDHRDAVAFRGARSVDSDGRSVDFDLPRIGPIGTRKHLHQRRFARTVFAYERMDFTALHRE